ncbi:metallophosphoesterase [Kurthia sibirica]|uniref:Phosphoesterase n=1 Tax=Kurthia sibirica TaxID=202750 RepID=A0A2U3AND0_9BACL|nr:metallophosphoesterase [Kurthia sibirica]PWI26038.1 phosphoesterase [Kurthia sibirica]GEK34561.1 phosphoesterase [Kurthia sibirica]
MKKLLTIGLIISAFCSFLYLNNSWLQVSKYNVSSKKLPKSFDGLKVVQISDLHDAKFGKNHEKLIHQVAEAKPDLIVITGDLIDSNNYKLQRSLAAVKGFVKIAPTYYIDGNHEIAINKVAEIQSAVEKIGVTVLNNEAVPLQKGHEMITIVGISDPLSGEKTEDMLAHALHQTTPQSFKLLLAHRSEFSRVYAQYGIDLAFTGHAHGGQVRIPGVGGVIDHQLNLFPKHLEGVEHTGGLTQVISRGLGNSLFPLRIFNRPEIVVTTLHTK